MNDQDQPTLETDTEPAGGYPLGLLFVLVAVCGIVLAMLSPALREPQQLRRGPAAIVAVMLMSGVAGALAGGALGIAAHRRISAACWGLLIGLPVGVVIGSASIVPRAFALETLGLAAVGSTMLAVAAWLVFRAPEGS